MGEGKKEEWEGKKNKERGRGECKGNMKERHFLKHRTETAVRQQKQASLHLQGRSNETVKALVVQQEFCCGGLLGHQEPFTYRNHHSSWTRSEENGRHYETCRSHSQAICLDHFQSTVEKN